MARPREGDSFAVPLGEAGYAVGLVARAPKRGDVLFGYFFGPVHAELPSRPELEDLTPGDAVLVTRFLDTALESGAWPVVATTDAWERDAWPMPDFFMDMMAEFSGEYVLSRYSEDNPDTWLGDRTLASGVEAATYPVDARRPGSHVEYALADVEVFQRGDVRELHASADEVEATLTTLAERHGGEYDGREWALPN